MPRVSFVITSELRRALDAAPLTIADFAQLIHMHCSGLSRYYHGQPFGRQVRPNLQALAELLSVPTDCAIKAVSRRGTCARRS